MDSTTRNALHCRAASGSPTKRNAFAGDGVNGVDVQDVPGMEWASYDAEHDVNIVLHPVAEGAAFPLEEAVGDRHCQFWDEVRDQ
jgi:hypothetical protein